MQDKSLTAEIAGKGKKHLQNFEPTFFSQIPYSNVREINYLRDLEQKKQQIDFPIFEFEKDFGEEAPVNEFDMLANTLYKKIMQQGYIQQKKAPSKRKKKTKNPFEYDYEDAWINDEQAITVKKNIYVKFENFKCFSQGIDQFYNSELYKSSLSQIQQQSKKRANGITMDAQQLEQIKKKIKQNISINHSKMKEQIQAEKQTMMAEENFKQQLNVQKKQTSNAIKNEQLTIIQVKQSINPIKQTQNKIEEKQQQNQNNIKEANVQINGEKIVQKKNDEQGQKKKVKKSSPKQKTQKQTPSKSKAAKKSSKNEKRQKVAQNKQKQLNQQVNQQGNQQNEVINEKEQNQGKQVKNELNTDNHQIIEQKEQEQIGQKDNQAQIKNKNKQKLPIQQSINQQNKPESNKQINDS